MFMPSRIFLPISGVVESRHANGGHLSSPHPSSDCFPCVLTFVLCPTHHSVFPHKHSGHDLEWKTCSGKVLAPDFLPICPLCCACSASLGCFSHPVGLSPLLYEGESSPLQESDTALEGSVIKHIQCWSLPNTIPNCPLSEVITA